MGGGTRGAGLFIACSIWVSAVYAQTQGEPAEKTKVSIRGVVTDESTGEPVRKAYFELMRRRAGAQGAVDQTPIAISDATGHFVFQNIEPGDYSLRAQRSGYVAVFLENLHAGAAGQQVLDVRVPMVRMGSILVHVLDPDGDPVPAASVALYRLTFRDGKRRLEPVASFSGDDVNLVPHLLEPGRYYVAAAMGVSGNRRMPVAYLPTWYPESPDAATAAPVTLAPGQNISDLQIRLRSGAAYRIRGVVTGLPPRAKDARPYYVIARRHSNLADDPTEPSDQVDAKGAFELHGANPGTYDLQVAQTAFTSGRFSSACLGTATVQVGQEDLDNISVQASPPRTVLLHVRTDSDAALDVSHLALQLETLNREYQSSLMPLGDANYEAQGIGAGQRYTLRIWGQKDVGTYVKSISSQSLRFQDQVIDADAVGADGIEVVLSIHGGSIGATVTDGEGAAVDPTSQHITVLLSPDSADAGRRERDAIKASTDGVGAIAVRNIPPGKYQLFAWRDLPAGAWKDADFWRQMSSEGMPITIAEDDRRKVTLTLIAPDRTKALLDRLDIR